MSNETCKTCKHWGTLDIGTYGPRATHRCYSVKFLAENRIVPVESDYLEVEVDHYHDALVEVEIRTGPDFGCIHHEAKQ